MLQERTNHVLPTLPRPESCPGVGSTQHGMALVERAERGRTPWGRLRAVSADHAAACRKPARWYDFRHGWQQRSPLYGVVRKVRSGRTARRAAVRPPAMSGTDADLRLPPHSVEAERSLLGGLMLGASAWLEVAERVSADDFFRPQHRMISGVEADEPWTTWRGAAALSARSLLDKAGGSTTWSTWWRSTPGASNVAAYAGIVRERATLRRLLAAANGIASSGAASRGKGQRGGPR